MLNNYPNEYTVNAEAEKDFSKLYEEVEDTDEVV